MSENRFKLLAIKNDEITNNLNLNNPIEVPITDLIIDKKHKKLKLNLTTDKLLTNTSNIDSNKTNKPWGNPISINSSDDEQSLIDNNPLTTIKSINDWAADVEDDALEVNKIEFEISDNKEFVELLEILIYYKYAYLRNIADFRTFHYTFTSGNFLQLIKLIKNNFNYNKTNAIICNEIIFTIDRSIIQNILTSVISYICICDFTNLINLSNVIGSTISDDIKNIIKITFPEVNAFLTNFINSPNTESKEYRLKLIKSLFNVPNKSQEEKHKRQITSSSISDASFDIKSTTSTEHSINPIAPLSPSIIEKSIDKVVLSDIIKLQEKHNYDFVVYCNNVIEFAKSLKYDCTKIFEVLRFFWFSKDNPTSNHNSKNSRIFYSALVLTADQSTLIKCYEVANKEGRTTSSGIITKLNNKFFTKIYLDFKNKATSMIEDINTRTIIIILLGI